MAVACCVCPMVARLEPHERVKLKMSRQGTLDPRFASAIWQSRLNASPLYSEISIAIRHYISRTREGNTFSMPAAVSPNPRVGSAGPDDLDNLLDYDDAVNDFFKDLHDNDDQNANNAPAEPAKDIDEEIKVTKKRKPNPKLDQDRLLSDAGVPKLRRLAKNKLQFKGKGHEFADISRILNLYQLWLDDLYPKAKFKDGLAMIEKLGHSKRLQVSRRAWMDETKPFRRREDEDAEMQDAGEGAAEKDDDAIFPAEANGGQAEQAQQSGADGGPADDELDALFAEESIKAGPTELQKSKGPFEDDDGPDEDELDALLAEESRPAPQSTSKKTSKQNGPFEDDDEADMDELDALMAEESQRDQSKEQGREIPIQNASSQRQEDNFDDDEEAMQEMGW